MLKIATFSLLSMTFLTAFGRDEIKTYSTPKSNASAPAPSMAAAMQAGRNDIDINAAPVSWTTPAAWKELPPTSIRLGNFLYTSKSGKKAELAITSFPGSVGTELDNWNRWRREVGLAGTTDKEIVSEPVKVGTADGKLYDLPGTVGRIVVATLPKGDATWFFKMKGEKEAVTEAKPTFVEFLKSIRFEAKPGEAKTVALDAASADPHALLNGTTNDPHAGLNLNTGAADPHANIAGFDASAMKAAPAGEEAELPKWTAPANWKDKPAGMMVAKAFSVSDDKGGSANVAISVFPGNVGGDFANVNRWRGQLGLPPVNEAEFQKLITTANTISGKATFVDFKGTDAKTGKSARLVAAIVPHGDNTWFYKLLGDDAVVGKEKEGFTKFVETVQYAK